MVIPKQTQWRETALHRLKRSKNSENSMILICLYISLFSVFDIDSKWIKINDELDRKWKCRLRIFLFGYTGIVCVDIEEKRKLTETAPSGSTTTRLHTCFHVAIYEFCRNCKVAISLYTCFHVATLMSVETAT